MSMNIKWKTEPSFNNNELLEDTSPLKETIVQYVGDYLSPEDENITIEMVVEVLAREFPEIVLALAEENWTRGYEQGLEDVRAFGEE